MPKKLKTQSVGSGVRGLRVSGVGLRDSGFRINPGGGRGLGFNDSRFGALGRSKRHSRTQGSPGSLRFRLTTFPKVIMYFRDVGYKPKMQSQFPKNSQLKPQATFESTPDQPHQSQLLDAGRPL